MSRIIHMDRTNFLINGEVTYSYENTLLDPPGGTGVQTAWNWDIYANPHPPPNWVTYHTKTPTFTYVNWGGKGFHAGPEIYASVQYNGSYWDPGGVTTTDDLLYPQPTTAFTKIVTGLSVSFTDTSPNPYIAGSLPILTPESWLWDFGDSNTSTLQNPTHVYATSGIKLVNLTVTYGYTTTFGAHVLFPDQYHLAIKVPPVIADFTHSPTSQIPGVNVSFTDTSTGNPTTWHWDFGDSNTSTLQNPTHSYSTPDIYTVELIAGDGGYNPPSTITHAVTIAYATLSIDNKSLPNICFNSAYTPQTFTLTGGVGPYTWADISSPALPTGMSFDPSTQTLSGTPTSIPGGGDDHVALTLEADSTDHQTATKGFTFLIYTLPIITVVPYDFGLIPAVYHTFYTADITASIGAQGGGDTWPTITNIAIVSGSLPGGLTLSGDPTTGIVTISGTITSHSGYFPFTTRVTDSHGCSSTEELSINVTETTMAITTSGTLPGSCRGVSYDQTLAVVNGTGPYTWSITSGSLPTTLSLDSSTGEITGTVDSGVTVQVYDFTVEVTDSFADTASKPFSIEVYQEPVWVTTTLPGGNVGIPYSQWVTATNGLGYGGQSGTLPDGLTFDSSGFIHGTPSVQDTFDFVARATSTNGCFTDQALEIIIGEHPPVVHPPAVGGGFTNVCNGVSYFAQVTATDGTPPYTFAITAGSLPGQLTLGATGTIQGITAEPGDFTFDITVTDRIRTTGTATFGFTVYDSPVITTPAIPPGVIGRPFSYEFTYTHGTKQVSWILYTPLPEGLVFNPVYGTITGTPTAYGYFPVEIGIQDSHSCMDTKQSYLVIAGPPGIVTYTLPPACVNQPYSIFIIVDGGVPDYYWFIDSDNYPPQNLVLNPYTGELAGIPLLAGLYPFTVKVIDSNNLFTQKDYILTVRTAQECGQPDEGDTIKITKARLTSLESEPVVVIDPFHQRHLIEYLPVPFVLDK